MARTSKIPVDVREAIGAFLDKEQGNSQPLAMSEALDAIRRIFPDLEVSDSDLIDAITGEAIASDVRMHIDVPRPDRSGALERWDNEGGAIKKRLSNLEAKEARRKVVNDTDGSRRRASETQSRNRIV